LAISFDSILPSSQAAPARFLVDLAREDCTGLGTAGNTVLSNDSAYPQKVDGMHWNRWMTYSGITGDFRPDYASISHPIAYLSMG
jgi:hypothetical protein